MNGTMGYASNEKCLPRQAQEKGIRDKGESWRGSGGSGVLVKVRLCHPEDDSNGDQDDDGMCDVAHGFPGLLGWRIVDLLAAIADESTGGEEASKLKGVVYVHVGFLI